MSITKLINIILPTKYNKITKLIKALDVQGKLTIAEYNHFAVEKIEGVDVLQSCMTLGCHNSSMIAISVTSIDVYPLSIIQICEKYSLNVYDFTEWMVDKIYTNIEKGIYPTYKVNLSVLNRLRMEVK